MAATNVSFRWLDLLEKEFDKAFVDLDLLIGEVDRFDVDETDFQGPARSRLETLSSCFAQLAHKSQTVFQANAKLEAELVHLRQECAESRAFRETVTAESRELLMRLHSAQLQLHSTNGATSTEDSDKIRERLERELLEQREKTMKVHVPQHEGDILKKENESLRHYILGLQGELYGAKLAAKYLDKELAGRIQQIQLLGRDLRGEEHDKLWHQLEAEIHLHRHKTVVRACRNRFSLNSQFTADPRADAREDGNATGNSMARPTKLQQRRTVILKKAANEGLGMSVTGGREHGVPVLISVIHPDTPASRSGQLYVGDAILSVNDSSLKEVTHIEAVQLLSSQEGTISLEVIYISPEDDDDDDASLFGDPYGFKYKIFDEDVVSLASSQLMPNGRLSRASVESVRGSTDNMLLESPRRQLDIDVITESREESFVQDGHCNHTTANGISELSNGFSCDAISQESINGTAGRLEFHSDMGSEDEGNKSSNNLETSAQTVDHGDVEVASEVSVEKPLTNRQDDPQQNSTKEGEEEVEAKDFGDNSLSVMETLDSVTESSLSSPSIEENEDTGESCKLLEDSEQNLGIVLNSEEKSETVEHINACNPAPATVLFNGSY